MNATQPTLRRSLAVRAAVGIAVSLAAAGIAAVHAAKSQPGVGVASGARPLNSGWLVRWNTPAGAARTGTSPGLFNTVSPTGAYALEPGESIDPRMAASEFEVVLGATVRVDVPGKYRFGFVLDGGTANLRVFGNSLRDFLDFGSKRPDAAGDTPAPPQLTDWISFDRGAVQLQYTLRRSGDSRFRFAPHWQMERAGGPATGFDVEPIPAGALVAPAFQPNQPGPAEALHGEALLRTLGCLNCHAPSSHPTSHSPVRFRGPDLKEAAARADAGWIRRWVASPQTMNPGSGMPDVLPASARESESELLTHYLVSISAQAAPEHDAPEGDAARGNAIFHSIGCIACHGVLDQSMPGANWKPPSPLGDVSGKWRPGALAAFLADPAATHPQGRMPSMSLSATESQDLAAYLTDRWGAAKSTKPTFDAALAQRGRAVFAARGCAACHAAGSDAVATAPKRKSLHEVDPLQGCLDPADVGTPRYTLSDTDRLALRAAVARRVALGGNSRSSPAQEAMIAIDSLGCTACHEWHGAGGTGPLPEPIRAMFTQTSGAELGDEGRLPPRLGGVGAKLTEHALRGMLRDGDRVRPYMATRMPRFSNESLGLIERHLANLDGVFLQDREPMAVRADDAEAVEAGRSLAGEVGLNCISCHVYADRPPTGTPGPAITGFAERLRYPWFARYMRDPGRAKQGTRMTNFFQTGRSTVGDIYDGDPTRQIEALWKYFEKWNDTPPPVGIGEEP